MAASSVRSTPHSKMSRAAAKAKARFKRMKRARVRSGVATMKTTATISRHGIEMPSPMWPKTNV